MMTIYELLAQRQAELEDKESELLVVVKELETVQQELSDIRQMTNIRLLTPAAEDAPNVAPEEAEEVSVDVSDLIQLKAEFKEIYGG